MPEGATPRAPTVGAKENGAAAYNRPKRTAVRRYEIMLLF